MDTLPWIQVDTNLRNHPKSLALACELEDPRAHTYLPDLWCWAARNAPDGFVRGRSAAAIIEGAVGWVGPRGVFTTALVKERWLDVVDDGFYLHDWHEWAGAHIEKAEKERVRKREVARKSRGSSALLAEESRESSALVARVSLSPLSSHKGEEVQEKGADPLELQNTWNNHPELPQWRETGKLRRRKAEARLKERPLAEWAEVISRIARSRFCLGGNERAWIATPDWLLKPDTAAKVLEGKYDDRTPLARLQDVRKGHIRAEDMKHSEDVGEVAW